MGWGWGWPVDGYPQGGSHAPDSTAGGAHQFASKDVSQAGYTMLGNEFSAIQGMAVQVRTAATHACASVRISFLLTVSSPPVSLDRFL